MKILIPPSEGKAKIKATNLMFSKTNFKFERYVNQVVRLLELIDNEDLRSVYGTSSEKALAFHRQNQDIFNSYCAPAIERYTGVVYEHIDWNTMSDKGKKYMERSKCLHFCIKFISEGLPICWSTRNFLENVVSII